MVHQVSRAENHYFKKNIYHDTCIHQRPWIMDNIDREVLYICTYIYIHYWVHVVSCLVSPEVVSGQCAVGKCV